MTYTSILTRALLSALVVGAITGGYLLTVVEPVLDRAIVVERDIAAETDRSHDDTHHDDPLYTRREQKGAGAAAMVLFALALGLTAGTVFAWRRHKLPGATDLHRAVWLAMVGFVAFAFVPAIVYPANPPGVGDPDTVGQRTLQYLGVIAISIALIVVLTKLSGRLRATVAPATRTAVVAVVSVVAFGLLVAVMPSRPVDIDPAVPADLVWDFRLRSIGGLALLWFGFGIAFGWSLSRHPKTDDDSPTGTRYAATRP